MQPGHKANQSSTANDGKSAELPQHSPSLISTSFSLPPSLPRSLAPSYSSRLVLSHGPSSLGSGLITTLVSWSLSSHTPASAGTKWITLVDTRAVKHLCINIHCFTNIFLTSALFSFILTFSSFLFIFFVLLHGRHWPVLFCEIRDTFLVGLCRGKFKEGHIHNDSAFVTVLLDNAKAHFFWQHFRLTGNKSVWQPAAVVQDILKSFVKELDSGSPYGQ